jgi:FixJ family two-component response regulator
MTGRSGGSVADHSQRRLAVVDDDMLTRRALERLLVTMGFAVAAFSSAEAYLEHAEPDGFRCLLLDVQLGGMSGPELSTHLAARGQTTPILFISASTDAEQLVRVATGGAAAVLAKPLDAEQLRSALETLMAV